MTPLGKVELYSLMMEAADLLFNPPSKLYWTAFLKKGKKKINGVKLQKAIYPWDLTNFGSEKTKNLEKKIYLYMMLC